MTMHRRAFLSLASLPTVALRAYPQVRRNPRLGGDPFQLGVASGDPAPDGFVLWTRLALDPLNGGGMPGEPIDVRWQVAADENMRRPVRQGVAAADPRLGHSVHVEVAGLDPDRWYWYRFAAGGEESAVGRARTAPAPNAQPERLRFAFASCQHYESGYYTAYKHMADENPDMIVHLGDYIYEGAANPRVRAHRGGEIKSLDDYRNRHALYRTDADLQRAHAACPWLVTWDDHELDNNYAAQVSEEPDIDIDDFLTRRAHAYRAYYEHMPLRAAQIPQGAGHAPVPALRIRPAGEFRRPGYPPIPHRPAVRGPHQASLRGRFRSRGDPSRRTAGEMAVRCARSGLPAALERSRAASDDGPRRTASRGTKSRSAWDQWSGYDADRKRVLRFFEESKVSNPVVLTGDIHAHWVNDLKVDFDDKNSPAVASEFVGTSISSSGDGSPREDYAESIRRENLFRQALQRATRLRELRGHAGTLDVRLPRARLCYAPGRSAQDSGRVHRRERAAPAPAPAWTGGISLRCAA